MAVDKFSVTLALRCRPEITEAQMMEGFHSMIDRYNEQKRQLKSRRPWVDSTRRPGVPPSVMTVTHVNQTKDLYVCCVICSLMFHLFASLVIVNYHFQYFKSLITTLLHCCMRKCCIIFGYCVKLQPLY